MHKKSNLHFPCAVTVIRSALNVPPDFYIPDFDEDEQNPDERVDQHTQDKHIQRDDEYYDGDHDNDDA
ncbi:Histone deacetylase 17 [Capsicum chinense]|nr:Histone deacetylase 17 [Capsicum chinense]